MLTMNHTDLANRVNGGTVVGTRAAGTLLAPTPSGNSPATPPSSP